MCNSRRLVKFLNFPKIVSGQTIMKIRHRKGVRKIYQNKSFLWSVLFRIWTESYPYFPVFGENQRICLNTEKYRNNSVNIRENTDQRKPCFGIFYTVQFSWKSFDF